MAKTKKQRESRVKKFNKSKWPKIMYIVSASFLGVSMVVGLSYMFIYTRNNPKMEETTIQSNLDKIEDFINKKVELEISNWNELEKPTITESNEFMNIKDNGEGKFEITLLKVGTTEITINANNVKEPKKIAVQVKDLLTIESNVSELNDYVGKDSHFEIRNYNELKNLKITQSNEILEITNKGQGNYNVNFIQSGTTEITITADNTKSNKVISVVSNELLTIDTNYDSLSKLVGQTDKFIIRNYTQLTQLDFSFDSNYIDFENRGGGDYYILFKKEGNTELTLTAYNGITKIIPIEIFEEVEIRTNVDNGVEGFVGNETHSIQIQNPKELRNFHYEINNDNIEINKNEGSDFTWLNIKMLKVGETNVILTADNSKQKVIKVIVKDLIDIKTNYDSISGVVEESLRLEITNWGSSGMGKIDIKSSPFGLIDIEEIQSGVYEIKFIREGEGQIVLKGEYTNEKVIPVVVSEKLIDIDYNIDNNEGVIGTTLTLNVNNELELKNLKVSGSNENIVIRNSQQGLYEIDLEKVGTTELTISADNSNPVNITIKIFGKDIKTDISEISGYVNQIKGITILNWEELENVSVSVDNESVSVSLSSSQIGIINVGFESVGTATITISADNGADNKITAESLGIVPIDIDKESIVGYEGEETFFQVANWEQLENLEVKSNDTPTAIVEKDTETGLGYYIVKLVSAGETSILITADNGITTHIDIEVRETTDIITDWDSLTGYVGDAPKTLNIDNWVGINDLEVKASNENISIEKLNQGQYRITLLAVGTSEIVITGEGVKEKRIPVEILSKLDIDISDYWQIFVGGESIPSIKNYKELKNVKVEVDSEYLKVDTDMIPISGQFQIVALKVGTTMIKITADNSNEKLITIEILPKLNIEVSRKELNGYTTKEYFIQINNMSDLQNPVVKAEQQSNVVEVGQPNTQGIFKVSVLGEGTASIIVSADNGNSVSIPVHIEPAIEIETYRNWPTGSPNSTYSIVIENYKELKNVYFQVFHNGVEIDAWWREDAIGSIFEFKTGSEVGEIKVIVNADNGILNEETIRIVFSNEILPAPFE